MEAKVSKLNLVSFFSIRFQSHSVPLRERERERKSRIAKWKIRRASARVRESSFERQRSSQIAVAIYREAERKFSPKRERYLGKRLRRPGRYGPEWSLHSVRRSLSPPEECSPKYQVPILHRELCTDTASRRIACEERERERERESLMLLGLSVVPDLK